MNDFEKCKIAYHEMRKKEKKFLIEFLKQNGYEVLNEKGGMGKRNYTSGSRLNKPYDLSNWMWVEARKNDLISLVSFQAFDVDPTSKNIHVLMDRIGVYNYNIYNPEEVFKNMVVTDIDLPFEKEDLNELLDYLV